MQFIISGMLIHEGIYCQLPKILVDLETKSHPKVRLVAKRSFPRLEDFRVAINRNEIKEEYGVPKTKDHKKKKQKASWKSLPTCAKNFPRHQLCWHYTTTQSLTYLI